jgi:hypothetical protein
MPLNVVLPPPIYDLSLKQRLDKFSFPEGITLGDSGVPDIIVIELELDVPWLI